MASVIFFAPAASVAEIAEEEYKQLEMDVEVHVSQNSTILSHAQRLAGTQPKIMIARGYQASLLKLNTRYPVAEIEMSGQEIALLIKKAKISSGLISPKIAIVGFENMLPDTEHFGDIFEVELQTFFASTPGDLQQAVRQAGEWGADILIGGETANREAKKYQIPTIFLDFTRDSIRNALQVARRMLFAAAAEHRAKKQIQTLLDYSFNGIIQIDAAGCIQLINHIATSILGATDRDLQGKKILDLIPSLSSEQLSTVILRGEDSVSTPLTINGKKAIANLAPIQSEGGILGAIFSFYEVQKLEYAETDARKMIYSAEVQPRFDLGVFQNASRQTKANLELVEQFAGSDLPVLITGPSGSEKLFFAQEIHRQSDRNHAPWIFASCPSALPGSDYETLFGARQDTVSGRRSGLFFAANRGTLYIDDIAGLGLESQRMLCHFMSLGTFAPNTQSGLSVRVVAATSEDLWSAVAKGRFLEELYYYFTPVEISLPALALRPKDIPVWVDVYIKDAGARYNKYVSLTQEAIHYLQGQLWGGNLSQLKSFCEFLVVSAKHRTIGAAMVEQGYQTLYPVGEGSLPSNPGEFQKSELELLLKKYGGNRTLTAQALGISKTTLWRRLKQHSLDNHAKEGG